MRYLSTLATASLGLVLSVAAPARATEDFTFKYKPRVEIFLSSLFANSANEGSFGLRGALKLRDRFHVESSLSRLDDDRVDLYLVDVSAKYYVRESRTDLYLVAGPGLFYSSDLDADELMLHFGFGAEFSFGDRFYLRPEIRGRWFTENFDETIGDLSVGFGWRF